MCKENNYINKFIKIYPILKGFTDDLLFFIAIDTLFLTVVKGLSSQEIVLLTTISSIFSIICRLSLIKVIKKNWQYLFCSIRNEIITTFGNINYFWSKLFLDNIRKDNL